MIAVHLKALNDAFYAIKVLFRDEIMGEKVNPAGETGQRSRRHGLECPLDIKQGK